MLCAVFLALFAGCPAEDKTREPGNTPKPSTAATNDSIDSLDVIADSAPAPSSSRSFAGAAMPDCPSVAQPPVLSMPNDSVTYDQFRAHRALICFESGIGHASNVLRNADPSGTVIAAIQPVGGSHHVSIDTSFASGAARVVARIQNFSYDRTERAYQVGPRKTAYWIVRREAGGKLTSRLWVYDTPQKSMTPIGTPNALKFTSCHVAAGRNTSKADFNPECCSQAGPGNTCTTPVGGFLAEDGAPPWITCAQGCCIISRASDGGSTPDIGSNPPKRGTASAERRIAGAMR